MTNIETIHRATIFYEAEADIVDKIENKAFDLETEGLEVETMCGNACCSPNIICESECREKVEWFVKKIESYINRFKEAELIQENPLIDH